ncbi:MAG: 50S ribosomal protein L31 [Dehalococcoidia bacterium]|nr:50S ribosomal protein L31 [Dehalococcoidia bacterium]
MRKDIHPEYMDAKVVCACGNAFETRATKSVLKVELCSQCHPFFSGGERRIVDTAGQVERFKRRYMIKE